MAQYFGGIECNACEIGSYEITGEAGGASGKHKGQILPVMLLYENWSLRFKVMAAINLSQSESYQGQRFTYHFYMYVSRSQAEYQTNRAFDVWHTGCL